MEHLFKITRVLQISTIGGVVEDQRASRDGCDNAIACSRLKNPTTRTISVHERNCYNLIISPSIMRTTIIYLYTPLEYYTNFCLFPHPKIVQKPPPRSRFRKSFPASCENQGSTYIEIVSPTVFIQVPKGHTKSQWLLWIARNCCGVQIVGDFWV